MSGSPHTCVFRYDGLAVRFSSAERADLAWLEEFLGPWFECGCGAEDCRVDLIADEHDQRRLVERAGSSDGEPAHCFSLDSGELRLPTWRLDGARLVRDERLGCSYLVEGAPARVRILTTPGNLRARFAAMRIIRELAMEHVRARGHMLLHAACLAAGDDAFLIAGAKGAGKTSLLLSALLRADARFVSNDRVVVRRAAGELIASGMPTIVSIRRQTLDMNAAIRQRLVRDEPGHWLAARDETIALPAPSWRSDSVDLTPARVCAILGVQARASARVRALLFPRPREDGDPAGAVELAPAVALHRLSQSFFGGDATGTTRPGLFASLLPESPRHSPQHDMAADLVARVPSFDCPMHPVEGGTGPALAEILDRWAPRGESPRRSAG